MSEGRTPPQRQPDDKRRNGARGTRHGSAFAPKTMRAVAEHAGVSIGTVSNFLNRPEIVAAATRERIRTAVEEVGYVRNASASQLRSGRGTAVGLVMFESTNPFSMEVARGVEAAASRADLLVILCNSDGSEDREARYLRLLEEQRVGGVVITPIRERSDALETVYRRGTPVVLLDRLARHGEHCAVGVDNVHGGRIATEHLVALGHRSLMLVNGPAALPQSAERRQGFMEVARRHGADITVRELVLDAIGAESAPLGERAVPEILATRPRPTAIFCTNDLLAVGVLRGLLAAGVRVPEDIALIGYDDVDVAAVAHVPLTSVRMPMNHLGRAAMELLLTELDEREAHEHRSVVFKPELVVRASTVPAAA